LALADGRWVPVRAGRHRCAAVGRGGASILLLASFAPGQITSSDASSDEEYRSGIDTTSCTPSEHPTAATEISGAGESQPAERSRLQRCVTKSSGTGAGPGGTPIAYVTGRGARSRS